MPDESLDAFVPIRDESDQVTGVMDRATADYLASQASDPTQQSIDALLKCVTRVRVFPVENYRQEATRSGNMIVADHPRAPTGRNRIAREEASRPITVGFERADHLRIDDRAVRLRSCEPP